MGNSVAKAREAKDEEKERVQNLINILENKRKEFVERVKLTRGEGNDRSREIGGGRTASRISEIRVQDTAGSDPQIKSAIGDFLTAAQGGDKAKNAAVEGATALLSAGLDALFGATSGAGLEKEGFVVLFINFAFVRVDYYVYSYNASGSQWGAKANESGSCYVADLAILEPNQDVKAHEVDYLLGQALSVPENSDSDVEYNAILKMKVELVQSTILSRLLAKEDLTLSQLADITKQLVETQKNIREAFASLSDFNGGPSLLATPNKPRRLLSNGNNTTPTTLGTLETRSPALSPNSNDDTPVLGVVI